MFTNKFQIEILNKVLERLITEEHMGLCTLIRTEIEKALETNNTNTYIETFIPLFTRDNAIKYANASIYPSSYWWVNTKDCYDAEDRITFINWIINELRYLDNEGVILYKNSINGTEEYPVPATDNKYIELSINANFYIMKIKIDYSSMNTTKKVDKTLLFENVKALKAFIENDNYCYCCKYELLKLLTNK